jgi:uncharacterized repeat protein (TIGR01451 family)
MRIVIICLIFIIMLSSGVAFGSLGMKLTKTCDVYDANFEETVNYTYYLENTGTESLSSLKLMDDRLGAIPLSQTILAPSVNLSVHFMHQINETDMLVLPSPLRNYANATALGPLGQSVVSNTARFQLSTGFGGKLDVEKRLFLTPPPIRVGRLVTYRIKVTNPNTVPLHDVRIVKDVLYSPYAVINNSLTLDKDYLLPKETATCYYHYIVKEDDILGAPGTHPPAGSFDISNTIYAEGYPPWEPVGGIKVSSFSMRAIGCEFNSSQVVKKFASPTEGGINTEITFKIFVNNTGDTLLNRTELWDLLPAGLDYVSSSPVAVPTSNVNGTTTLYWTNLSQTLGILLVGGKYEVEVKAKISGRNLGTLINKVRSKSYNLRNEFNTSIDETPIIARKQNISVVKTCDISSGGPGALVNFSLTVKNTGNITLKNVFVNDLLPLGMTYQSSWPAGSHNQQYVNWPDIGSMMPDTSKQLWIKAVINGPISENRTLTNRVDVEGKPEYGRNVTANDTASLEAFRPNILVTKTSNLTFGSAGAAINFTLNVTNIGNGLLSHVLVSDLLPAGLSYVSSSIGSTHSGQTVNWSDIGPLGLGERKQLWIVAHIDGPVSGIQTRTNRVDVEGKPVHGNNVTNNTTTIVEVREPKITIIKTADPTLGSPSTNVNFTLVVNNTGSTLLSHVFVCDLLPTGMSYVSSSSGSTHRGQTVSWSDIGPLGPGERKMLWIVAQIDGPVSGIRTLTNRVDVEGKPEHGNNVTNSTTANVTAFMPNIEVTKNAISYAELPPTDITYIIMIINSGDILLDPVWANDTLVAGLAYVSDNRSGIVSGNSIAWNNLGSLAPGECTYISMVTHADRGVWGVENQVDVTGKPPIGNNVTNSTTTGYNWQPPVIYGQKFNDLNGNGTNDNYTDPGIPNWTIELVNESGEVVNSNTTDEYGYYWIGPVSRGNYTVREVQQPGWQQTCPAQGSYSINTDDSDLTGIDFGNCRISEINVTKVADLTFAPSGANITFDIEIVNKGETTLRQATAVDTLPAGMTYVSDNRSGSVSESTISWNDLGDLAPDASKGIELVGRIDRNVSGVLTNVVDVTAKDPGGNDLNDTATANVTAFRPNIEVTKNAISYAELPPTDITYIIMIINSGDILLDPVWANDTLVEGLGYVSDNRSGIVFGNSIAWNNLGSLAPGECTYISMVTHADGGVWGVINQVDVTGKPPIGNNVTNSTTTEYFWQPPVIYGQKFNDLNGNGTNDDYTDPGIPNWTIELVNESGEVVNSNTTDEYGYYWIGPVSRGNYTVREVQQPGWQQTCPAQGSYSINTDDSDLTGIDFGNRWISEINVTKVANPTSASPGANISFVINISNNGKTHLSHVHAVDTLPLGMSYISDNRNGSVSGTNISWNDLDDLDPGASNGIELVGRIDRNVSGVLINVVDVTAKDPVGNDLTDSAIAEVLSLLPKIKVSKEPVQYGQYCEAKAISGVGIIESRTSIKDKTIALEYDDALAGEGEIELESADVMSEAAEKLQRDVPSLDPENQSSLNLFADTKLAFKGDKPLTGGRSIHSRAFYGGSGARIKDIFSADEMEKEQTIYFSSTDQASSPQTIGTDLKSSFNGTIETDSKMHNMFRQDINSRQLFSGVFNLDKVIKFHKNVTMDEPKMGCDGIDC